MKPLRTSSPNVNIIEYRLSNEEYVQSGWTKTPKTRSMRKMILYETEIAKPHLLWHKDLPCHFYPDGGLFFVNEERGGKVYYPNGDAAIRIEKPKDRNYDLYTIFTPGGKDGSGVHRDPQMIAIFDTLGNGLVLNENGEMSLSYNQMGGIYMNNPGAILPLVWVWNRRKTAPIIGSTYTEVAATRLLETLEASGQTQKRVAGGNVQSPDNKCAIDDDKLMENSDRIESLTAVKTICLRLNEFMSLRILDRRNINLRFICGRRTVRFHLGFDVNYKTPISSVLKDTTSDPFLHLKSRVLDAWASPKTSPSLSQIFEVFRVMKKTASERHPFAKRIGIK
ncbi:uncharacterized protein LOC135161758 isoform X2 [Diachasmimorpha longicaudata]